MIRTGLTLLFNIVFLFGQEDLANDITRRVTDIMSPETMHSVGTQTIVTSSGKERTFEFESWSAGKGEKNLMRYTKPAAIRGQAFLMLNNADDIWTYFPRTKRVRKLASHAKKQRVQGSDFTYEDMGSGDIFLTAFRSRYLGEEMKNGFQCWKLALEGLADKDPPYPKLILWVRQSDDALLSIDYYNEKDVCTKTLTLSNIQMIENYPTAMKMVMEDHLKHSRTRMETLSVTYNWVPPKNFFTERNLKS